MRIRIYIFIHPCLDRTLRTAATDVFRLHRTDECCRYVAFRRRGRIDPTLPTRSMRTASPLGGSPGAAASSPRKSDREDDQGRAGHQSAPGQGKALRGKVSAFSTKT